jgi:phosphatidate cytidylyltransferase
MLKHRLLFGPPLILALVALIWLDEAAQRWTVGWFGLENGVPGVVVLPALVIAAMLATREIAPIFRSVDTRASKRVLMAAALTGLLATALTPNQIATFSGVAVLCSAAIFVLVFSMLFYSRYKTTEGVVNATSAAMCVFVYLGLLLGFLFLLRKEFTAWHLLAILIVTKGYDIGAYTAGRLFGRHKLIPWLSPGKTWEGLVGGVIASMLLAAGINALARLGGGVTGLGPFDAALIGGLIGLVGQAGDLVASVFKRDAGLKDYSATLPGFGGVMDVLDSPLLVAPVAYWMLVLLLERPVG